MRGRSFQRPATGRAVWRDRIALNYFEEEAGGRAWRLLYSPRQRRSGIGIRPPVYPLAVNLRAREARAAWSPLLFFAMAMAGAVGGARWRSPPPLS
jgi:hypothetical protein